MLDLGQNMITSDLWICILTFQRSSEVTDWLTPYIPIVANLVVLGFPEALSRNA